MTQPYIILTPTYIILTPKPSNQLRQLTTHQGFRLSVWLGYVYILVVETKK